MNDPYDNDQAYNDWRYDQFGDPIIPDEYDEYYGHDLWDEENDPYAYEHTYADEVEDSYDGY